MRLEFTAAPPAAEGALVVVVAKGAALGGPAAALDGRYFGALGRAVAASRFDGEAGGFVEVLGGERRVLVAGLGEADKADARAFEKLGAGIVARLLTSGETRVTIDFAGVATERLPLAEAAARLAHGAELRSYRFDKYRTTMKDKHKPTLVEFVVANAPAGTEAAFAPLAGIAAGVRLTRDLVSEPANIIYPESFVARAQALADLGVTIEVLGEPEMAALGMGALLGVSQGSERPARLLVMRWNGSGDRDRVPLVLVGKGVTFDTGGISLKPPAGMEDMKWDMGGAGAVTGAMHALAARNAKAHVVGVCGLVENMPDGKAQRPGDVVTTMSGQTVEVINTDAEGRLVLCDVIAWVQETLKPEVVVDLATLTGAIIISLGHEYGGVFANDDGLAAQLMAAGEATGDKLWRMPLDEAYDSLIDSQIADIRNVGPREGGSITAAKFIQRFVKPPVKWAHLDIAGMVWAAKAGTLWDKGATGYGVRLLDRFVADNFEVK